MKSVEAASNSKRFVELDALRGLAAIVVLVYHTQLLLPLGFLRSSWFSLHSPIRLFLTGRAPVLFFFVLSGYVLTQAIRNQFPTGWSEWAWRRTLRLCLPVAAGLLLSVMLFQLCFGHSVPHTLDSFFWRQQWTGKPTLTSFVEQAALLGDVTDSDYKLDPAIWSLTHEWRISLILPLIIAWRMPWQWLMALTAGLSLLLTYSGLLPEIITLGHTPETGLLSTAYFVAFFIAGYSVALANPCLPDSTAIKVLAWILVVIACAIGRDILVVAGSCALIVLSTDRRSGISRFLRKPMPQMLGRISYSLYITHLPVLMAVIALSSKWFSPWIIAIAGIATALPVSYIFFRLVEAPSHRLSKGISRRLTAA